MSQTGGNKKVSSPSTIRYWQRAQMGKFNETHRARRIARHVKRMGLNKSQADKSTLGCIDYGNPPQEKILEKVIFSAEVKDHRLIENGMVVGYPTFVIEEGTIVDVLKARRPNSAPTMIHR